MSTEFFGWVWVIGAAWGVLITCGLTAWGVAGHRVRDEKLPPDYVLSYLFIGLLSSAFWPGVLTAFFIYYLWGSFIKLCEFPHRRLLAKAKDRESRTPEAMARRVAAMRSEVEIQIKALEKDPLLNAVEIEQLRLVSQGLKAG